MRMFHHFYNTGRCFNISIPLLILIILLASSFFCSPVVFGITATTKKDQDDETNDHLALLDIKSKIQDDPHGILISWNSSLHHCNWKGITCGVKHRRVTILDLRSRALSGSLSPAIGNLSFLQMLIINDNKLQGHLPPQLGLLSRLQFLNASRNSFQGDIPANISHCLNLQKLSLAKNNFKGSIPSELGSLTHLTHLSLYLSGLTGEIPASLGRLSHLTFLSIGGDFISGLLPSSIFNLSSLIVFSIDGGLGGSSLHGTLPDDLGLKLPHLTNLHIQDTQIGGLIPSTLSNLSHIEIISLAQNRFTGRIPIDGRNLRNLTRLFLPGNNLGTQGDGDLSFIDSLVNCSRLYHVELSGNNIGGELPASVAHLSTNLEFLHLFNNSITGVIPSSLDNLVNLQTLDLSGNLFSGGIPDDISNLKRLSFLEFSRNNLSGVIPPSFGKLSQLIMLDLAVNELKGTIPSSLGDCTNLIYLFLDMNKLTGEIPAHLFHASMLSGGLFLQGNKLSGTLPKEVGQLHNLAVLDISNNNLSGNIPDSLGKCTSLSLVNISGNSFSGSIPGPLASLKGLSNLDLSSNNLSGQIPTYLSSFNLTNLNLSFNNLEGEVPTKGIFTNATGVSLVGNSKLCGGVNQLRLPECQTTITTSGTGHTGKKHLLIILVVAISSLLVVIAVALLLIRFCLKRKQQNVPSSEFLLGESFLSISYNTLLKATNGFSSRALIGMGSFGSVYKGILNTDAKSVTIAVKVINLQHRGSAKSFMRECKALRSIRHRNLISIISACSSIDFKGSDFKALVYEYMAKGNLDEWLHLMNPVLENTSEQETQISIPQNLSLQQRINIAIDVASALDYLHSDCEIPIVHCDLKPSNILLDDDMVAHVGDFGLARLLPDIINQSLSNSFGVQGTVGYAPPEYGLGNQISSSGDVYSYGIILLELMTAKRPTNVQFQNGLSLHDYAKLAMLSNVMEIIDPKLLEEIDEATDDTDSRSSRKPTSKIRWMECVLLVVKVGVECSIESPIERMSIKDAIKNLRAAMDVLPQSTQRF